MTGLIPVLFVMKEREMGLDFVPADLSMTIGGSDPEKS
jgi:hypothetical protein